MGALEKYINISNEGTRNQVRMRVVKELAKEEPGIGPGELASRYIYYVETLQSGDRVFLRRPASLYFGFDFLVCVEGANYSYPGMRRRNFPTHNDFKDDLEMKKTRDPAMYIKLYRLLQQVYDCHNVSDEEINSAKFDVGLPVDHIVKTIKWLFIEQDIRYWNYSGRNMTWGIVPRP